MALGKRVLIQRDCYLAIKADNGLTIADPAIDLEKSDLAKYKETLFDTKSLVMLPGEQPTVFTLRPLTTHQKNVADSLSGDRDRQTFFVRCGLVRMSNYIIENIDGSQSDPGLPEMKDHGRLGNIITEDWINKINFPSVQLAGLYLMVLYLSEAQLPLSKPSDLQSGGQLSSSQNQETA